MRVILCVFFRPILSNVFLLSGRNFATYLTKAMDAMSDAIDYAAVVLYGVSLAYKESANCRLEAVRKAVDTTICLGPVR